MYGYATASPLLSLSSSILMSGAEAGVHLITITPKVLIEKSDEAWSFAL
jgi:hypothetical protein